MWDGLKAGVYKIPLDRELFDGEEKEIELENGSSILDLLNVLCDSGQCRQRIFDNSGEPKTYIQIFKNRRPIRSFGGIHTELGEGDVVSIIPPVFGG